jgi:hypothetical protein
MEKQFSLLGQPTATADDGWQLETETLAERGGCLKEHIVAPDGGRYYFTL